MLCNSSSSPNDGVVDDVPALLVVVVVATAVPAWTTVDGRLPTLLCAL